MNSNAPASPPLPTPPSETSLTTRENSAPRVTFRYRLFFIAAALIVGLSWCGFHFGDRYGLLVGFFAAALLITLVSTYLDRRLVKMFVASELEGTDPYGIGRNLRSVADRLRVPVPKLFIVEAPTPNAFSAGFSKRRARLFVTRGLLERFSFNETSLILAYELEKIRREQTLSVTAAAACTSLIATLANAIDSILTLSFFRHRRELRAGGPLTFLTSPLVAVINHLASPRAKLLEIDRHISEDGNRRVEWAHVLAKLDAYGKTLPFDVNLAEASLFTINPLARYGWLQAISAQASVADRIRNLTGRAQL